VPEATLTEDRVKLLINEALTNALEQHENKMLVHLDTKFEQVVTAFASAFPGGDPHGHRLAHEKAIRTATEWDKMKADVTSKFLSAGLWATVGFVAFAVWDSVKAHIIHRP
jgi:hypothetical protein